MDISNATAARGDGDGLSGSDAIPEVEPRQFPIRLHCNVGDARPFKRLANPECAGEDHLPAMLLTSAGIARKRQQDDRAF